jgi:hypothetical protein
MAGKATFGQDDYLVRSFDKNGPLKMRDPVKPWLFDVFFIPNNAGAFGSSDVKKLWGDWTSVDCLRGYLKSADTHGKKFKEVSVDFFGIPHKYPGKPEPTQQFKIECVEHENLVVLRLLEEWVNLITNFDPNIKTNNKSMYSTAETIWDLSATVKIMNRGINAQYLSRHTEYICAWPSEITAAKMADMSTDGPVKKSITFTCLLGTSQKT